MLWTSATGIVLAQGLPERCAAAIYDAAFGLRLRNASYRLLVERTIGDEISMLTASRDLASLVHAGLLVASGERRGRHYVGSPGVRTLRERIRASRPPREESDPFAIANSRLQLSLE